MKKHNISIVVTVRAKKKKEAKEMLIRLMNNAAVNNECNFPEWGFHDEYKLDGEKVKK